MEAFDPLIPQMKTLCLYYLSKVIHWFHLFFLIWAWRASQLHSVLEATRQVYNELQVE